MDDKLIPSQTSGQAPRVECGQCHILSQSIFTRLKEYFPEIRRQTLLHGISMKIVWGLCPHFLVGTEEIWPSKGQFSIEITKNDK